MGLGEDQGRRVPKRLLQNGKAGTSKRNEGPKNIIGAGGELSGTKGQENKCPMEKLRGNQYYNNFPKGVGSLEGRGGGTN